MTIQLWDFFYGGGHEARFYYDADRGEMMAANIDHAGHIDSFTGPFKVESWKAWRREWEGTMPDESLVEWKRRAPITHNQADAIYTAIWDQSGNEGNQAAVAVAKKGLPAPPHGNSALGEYYPGYWVSEAGRYSDRYWEGGWLSVDESSPLIEWIAAPFQAG